MTRITFGPLTMGIRPRIRGRRATVGIIATNRSVDDVLRVYPWVQREDVAQALDCAAWWRRKGK